MNRNKCFRSFRNFLKNLITINITGYRIHIRKNGSGTKPCNTTYSGKKAVRSSNNLVAFPNIQCHKRKKKSICPGCTAYSIIDLEVLLYLTFECINFGTKNKMLALQHFINSLFYFIPYSVIIPG